MRILIIEEDLDFQKFLRTRLYEMCFAADTASCAQAGLHFAGKNKYDLLILGRSLPDANTLDICRSIRSAGQHLPIIVTSRANDIAHKIASFEAGADDYLIRPFFFDELSARMQALFRRPPLQSGTVLVLDDLSLDSVRQRVSRGNRLIYLTRKEFALLEYLLQNTGTVLARGQILEHVWDQSVGLSSNTLEMHICSIRKKVDGSRKKKLIHSIPGRGYKADISR